MLRNHIRIAWRSIKKDKLFTIIKIGGFSLGIAACLLISLYISDELGYDLYHTNRDRMYRVVLQAKVDGELMKSVHFQLPFAKALQADFPEVEKAGRANAGELYGGAGKRSFRVTGETTNNLEEGIVFADQAFFDIMGITLQQGSPGEALTRPGSLVISEKKAARYFPLGNAVGQTMIVDNRTDKPYTITGVMKAPRGNSHLQPDFLFPIEDTNPSWTNQNYFTYLLLQPNTDVKQLAKKMYSIMENYVIPAQMERGRTSDFIDVLKTAEYTLQPVRDIYLKSDLKMADGLRHGDIRFIWFFGTIAVFILILACINFINLSTAKSAHRAREVGLRKTVGAFRRNLVVQFITESVVYSVISFVAGVLLAWALISYFNSLAGKTLDIPWTEWWFAPILLLLAVIIGMIAGLYPAFYLSAFKPARVIKGDPHAGKNSGNIRSGLVVFQFTISVILIIGTLILHQQMRYILEKDLGFNKEQVVILDGANSLGNKITDFKEQLLLLPGINAVTITDFLPVEGSRRNGNTFTKVGEGQDGAGLLTQTWRVDYDYIKTMGMRLKSGRDFSTQFASDSLDAIIINGNMANALGWDNPIGKVIDNNYQQWKIIGVLEDFHFKSLREDISPLALVIGREGGAVSIKLSAGGIGESLSSIENIWHQYAPEQAFAFTFLDQKFAQMHADVQRMGRILSSFAIFAMVVACLGLFALSAYMVEQRKKEISIRIVLGAGFENIYRLLILDFMKWIVLSIAISIPVAGYLMGRWLEDFAYRTVPGLEVYLAAGAIAILIALLTISYQSIGAAISKPVKSLRIE